MGKRAERVDTIMSKLCEQVFGPDASGKDFHLGLLGFGYAVDEKNTEGYEEA